jgi:hypothetical protein
MFCTRRIPSLSVRLKACTVVAHNGVFKLTVAQEIEMRNALKQNPGLSQYFYETAAAAPVEDKNKPTAVRGTMTSGASEEAVERKAIREANSSLREALGRKVEQRSEKTLSLAPTNSKTAPLHITGRVSDVDTRIHNAI